MTFPELRSLIDARLKAVPRLEGSEHLLSGETSVWTLNRQVVTISASGPDADKALEALCSLVEDKFGEE